MNPESTNDVKSLAGKINTKAMGQKSSKQKLKLVEINKNKKFNENKIIKKNGLLEVRGGNILE